MYNRKKNPSNHKSFKNRLECVCRERERERLYYIFANPKFTREGRKFYNVYLWFNNGGVKHELKSKVFLIYSNKVKSLEFKKVHEIKISIIMSILEIDGK